MAQSKTIQLLRSGGLYVPTGSGSEAKTALENAKDAILQLSNKDGEVVLARYKEENSSIKTVMAIRHTTDLEAPQGSNITVTSGWTFLQDITSMEGSSQALQQEVDNIESSAGLLGDGTKSNFTDTDALQIISASDSLKDAIEKIAKAMGAADKSANAENGKVVTTVSQSNGVVSETKANVKDLQLGGYSLDSSATGAIGSTDTVNAALSKLENAIAANTVSSGDKTVTIDTTGATTDLSVNIDGTTLVKDTSTGVISSDLTLVALNSTEITALSDSNVSEAYKLIYSTDSNRTAIGSVIKIYKDSSLKEVYLGADNDTVNSSTGVVTKNTVTDPQTLNFVYHLADGTYSLVGIDVSKFLTESEFGDGLQVSSGVVSVKVDSTSESVITAYGENNTTSPVLSVSSNGVKVSNIQNAIDAKIGTLDGTALASTAPTSLFNGGFNGANQDEFQVLMKVSQIDGVIQPVDATTNSTGSKSVTLKKVSVTGAAADVSIADSGNLITATTVEGALQEIAGKANGALQSVSAGNNGVTVGTEDANHDQTISLNLDTSTGNNITSGTVTDMLTITNNGLAMNDTWDCGVF